MQLTYLLQDFGSAVAGSEALQLVSEAERDAQATASYEKGYDAGWEDGLQAKEQETAVLSGRLRENLQDLDFTLTEARRLAHAEFLPVMEALVYSVLPALLHEEMAGLISQELAQQMRDAACGEVCLSAASADIESLRPLVQEALGTGLHLSVDPSLREGQVSILLGETETIFDPNRFLGFLREQFAGFSNTLDRERLNG